MVLMLDSLSREDASEARLPTNGASVPETVAIDLLSNPVCWSIMRTVHPAEERALPALATPIRFFKFLRHI
jgi:hypothetical protein